MEVGFFNPLSFRKLVVIVSFSLVVNGSEMA